MPRTPTPGAPLVGHPDGKRFGPAHHGRGGQAPAALQDRLRDARRLRPPLPGPGGHVCPGGRRTRPARPHRRGRRGRPPGGRRRGPHHPPRRGRADGRRDAARPGRAAVHRADARGHSGGHRRHREGRRAERRAAGRPDPGADRRPAPPRAPRVPGGPRPPRWSPRTGNCRPRIPLPPGNAGDAHEVVSRTGPRLAPAS